MPLGAKKARKPWTGVHPRRPSRERRNGEDRRQLAGTAAPDERRRARGRRRSDLPRHRWLGLFVAAALGVGSAVTAQLWATPRGSPGVTEPVRVAAVPAATLAKAEDLRDQAEALTPTEVLLDEQARELWLPRLPELERLSGAADTAPALRHEARATLAALRRAGIGL